MGSVDALFLKTFKVRLNGFQPPDLAEDVPGGLGWMTFKGPFQPKALYDSNK